MDSDTGVLLDFRHKSAEVFVPDGLPSWEALGRTTHLGVGAHPDDLEILACEGILSCLHRDDRWFCGVVMTDGAGSPRSGPYGGYSDAEMRTVRRAEQKRAAVVGGYGAQVMLDYASSAVKNPLNAGPVEDLTWVLERARAEVIYTHSLADRHETHVATALRVIAAVRGLPAEARPECLYGCEVWGALDWLPDEEKVALDVSSHKNLQWALLGVFDSQVCGGKRYDLAAMGRRRANATYRASHEIDAARGMIFAMDLAPMVEASERDVSAYVQGIVERFARDVAGRIDRLGG